MEDKSLTTNLGYGVNFGIEGEKHVAEPVLDDKFASAHCSHPDRWNHVARLLPRGIHGCSKYGSGVDLWHRRGRRHQRASTSIALAANAIYSMKRSGSG